MIRKFFSELFFWIIMISITVPTVYLGTLWMVNKFSHDVVTCQIKSAKYKESSGGLSYGSINRFVVLKCENGKQFSTKKLPAKYQNKEEFAQDLENHRGSTVKVTVGSIRYIDGSYKVYEISGI